MKCYSYIVLRNYLEAVIFLANQITVSASYSGASLLTSYEGLNYDREALLADHSRISKRSARSRYQSNIRWSFYAHSRDFHIQISPDPHLLSKDFLVEADEDIIEFDRDRAYIGHILSQPKSHVTGVLLLDGRFEGKISDDETDFFVERAESVLPSEERNSSLFHSVIYKMSDIKKGRFNNTTTCKSHKLRDSTGRAVRASTPYQRDYLYSYAEDKSTHNSPHNMYSDMHKRGRRAIDPTKMICELYMQADYDFYERWGGNVDTVIEQLIAHVNAANSIYKVTDFDGDGAGDNIRFVIKKIKIWKNPTSAKYPFPGNYDVSNFLEKFSTQDNFDSFCLAYTFTHRDFNDGTLGLAWTGSLDSSGGVCTKNGKYNGMTMSLNTGIVTTLNFQQAVVFGVSQLTFAHELAHNFGSEHDSEADSECSPGSENGGNYIMFPKATDGDKPNNRKLSPCSVRLMNDVLNDKARHDGTAACFTEFSKSVCGNKVVEEGEDCDCGWDDQCSESCCNPQKDNYDPASYTPCTYTTGAICSPSEGSCCGDDCKVRPASENYQCRAATPCSEGANCDGTGVCPPSLYKPNGTDCDDGLVCYSGECSNAVCQANGLQLCQCLPETVDDWHDENLCKLCCMSEGVCTLSSQIAAITTEVNGVRGQPCFNYQGYCDAFLKCRQLDPVGTINNLQKLLSSEEGLATVTEWLKGNWYIILASGLGFIIIMVLVLRFCAKHEPIIPPEPKASSKNQILPK